MPNDTNSTAASSAITSHPSIRYRPDIDGLRAMAVMLVVLYHAFPTIFPGGFIGVDIFFVISGYLITSIIFTDTRYGNFSFIEFYCKRVRRIFPALITVLIFSLGVGLLTLLPEELQSLGKNVVGASLFISNILLWKETGYFDISSVYKPLLHLWSLGIEEQFYLIWPLLFLMAIKLHRTMSIVSVCCLSSFVVGAHMTNTSPQAAFYLLHSRAWELISGALLAIFTQEHQIKSIKAIYLEVAALVSFLTSLGCTFFLDESVVFPGYVALAPVIATLILISVGDKSVVASRLFSNKIAVGIGRISYPLYLWHWPILSYLTIIKAKEPSGESRLYAILISVALAYLTYRLIEAPIRRARHLITLSLRLVATMAVIGALGLLIYLGSGLPWRPMSQDAFNRDAFIWERGRNANSRCVAETAPAKIPFCVMTENYEPSVIMLGDSHANALFPFFAAYFAKEHRGVVMLGKGGCPPFINVEKNDFGCPDIMSNSLNFLKQHPKITDVYLIARYAETESGDNYFEKAKTENRMTLVTDSTLHDRRKIFKIALMDTVLHLKEQRKNVRIVLSIPELNFDPKTCLKARGASDCTISRDLVVKRQTEYRKIMSEISDSTNVPLIDPLDAFCDESRCTAKANGKILYRDFHHLGIFATDFLLERELKLD